MAKGKIRQASAALEFVQAPDAENKREPKQKTVSCLLDPDEAIELRREAEELGVNLNNLMQYIVRSFMARYKRGERPKLVEKKVKVLQVD